MLYQSTRGAAPKVSFTRLLRAGLAPDGGLYIPCQIPDVRSELAHWRNLHYVDLAYAIISLFVDDLAPQTLRRLIEESYATFDHPAVTPLVPVGDLFVLELFHGPTLAFKDVALQFLGRMLEELLREQPTELNLIVATSGDTGSAAIHGMRGRRGMRIIVMHPQGRVSEVQERQMTTVLDDNVHNLAVQGTFDDCQRIVKTLLADPAIKQRFNLSTVNSINWGRIVAQIVYYFYATFRVQEQTGAKQVRFSVPTGNFGDVFAGFMAHQMGLPIERLIVATNENDVLTRYFNQGEYRATAVVPTLSPAMDIQVASNFERYLYYLAQGDSHMVTTWMEGFAHQGVIKPSWAPLPLFAARRGDRAATLTTIRQVWEQEQYLLDPHSALGVYAANDFITPQIPTIVLATAHPAKFAPVIQEALGSDRAHHASLEKLAHLPTRLTLMPNRAETLIAHLRQITEGAV